MHSCQISYAPLGLLQIMAPLNLNLIVMCQSCFSSSAPASSCPRRTHCTTRLYTACSTRPSHTSNLTYRPHQPVSSLSSQSLSKEASHMRYVSASIKNSHAPPRRAHPKYRTMNAARRPCAVGVNVCGARAIVTMKPTMQPTPMVAGMGRRTNMTTPPWSDGPRFKRRG